MKRRHFIGLVLSQAGLGASCSSLLYGKDSPAPDAKPVPTPERPLLVKARRNAKQTWKWYPTRTVGTLTGFRPSNRRITLNRYGNVASSDLVESGLWQGPLPKKTGYFRIEKNGKRWWVIDPDGGAGLHTAVCSISRGNGKTQQAGYREKFDGKPQRWAEATLDLLRENGFNGAGNWSESKTLFAAESQQEHPFSSTITTNFMASYGKKRGGIYQKPGHMGYPSDCIFCFDPEFPKFCDEYAKSLTVYRDNPLVFGYFTDNEMPFPRKALDNYLHLENKDDPGRLAAEKWLKAKKKKWKEIDDELRNEFISFMAETYSSAVENAIRRNDPNHMILGPRLHGSDLNRFGLIKAIAAHTDILSCNYYGRWEPEDQHVYGWPEMTGKPFMTTEWYTKGEDSGLGNTTGAGWNVPTQQDRGRFYQNFTLKLLECGGCVGWHWFKYQDNDPTGKSDPSNLDSNKGIVDNSYKPYSELLTAMKELNDYRFDLIAWFDRKR